MVLFSLRSSGLAWSYFPYVLRAGMVLFFPNVLRASMVLFSPTLSGLAWSCLSVLSQGWQFPWESAFTGYEMTPLVCVPCRDYELHITGDIAFAARQYWAMTRDRKWLLQEGGINLIVNTATFWVDRAEYNQAQDRYEINGERLLLVHVTPGLSGQWSYIKIPDAENPKL